ncbi:sigma-70 family RNA polymerase sigma factor [Pseudomonas syringae pv. actinidiae]|nr:sigma-70 family RNA polymerase sigma factor [Pseudomonas syringae pv. actinidiae]
MSAAAKNMIDNTYMRDVSANGLLDHDEMLILARKAIEGDKFARKKMINANLRLVIKIAYNYTAGGMDIMDLISAGNEGLIHAVDRFDPEKGFTFSTYADHWIRFKIEDSVARNRPVHVPIHIVKEANKVVRTRRFLQGNRSRDVSDLEVANALRETGMEIDEKAVAALTTAIKPGYSLDAKVAGNDDEDGATFMSMLEGESDDKNDPENRAYNLKVGERVTLAMAEMSERQKLVISHYFGFPGFEEMNIADIGRLLDISRERARQILRQAQGILTSNLEAQGFTLDDVI